MQTADIIMHRIMRFPYPRWRGARGELWSPSPAASDPQWYSTVLLAIKSRYWCFKEISVQWKQALGREGLASVLICCLNTWIQGSREQQLSGTWLWLGLEIDHHVYKRQHRSPRVRAVTVSSNPRVQLHICLKEDFFNCLISWFK